jgi:hypothetical protein
MGLRVAFPSYRISGSGHGHGGDMAVQTKAHFPPVPTLVCHYRRLETGRNNHGIETSHSCARHRSTGTQRLRAYFHSVMLTSCSLLLHISYIHLVHPFRKILPALGLVRLQATRFVGCVLPNMEQAAGGTEEAVMCRDRRCVEGRTWMSGRGRWMPGVCERRQWRPCCIDVHHTQRPGRENIEKSFDR